MLKQTARRDPPAATLRDALPAGMWQHRLMRTPKRQHQAERARLKRMLGDHRKRTCDDCILIGEAIQRQLDKENVPRGETTRWFREVLDEDRDYHRRFIRIAQGEELLPFAWEKSAPDGATRTRSSLTVPPTC